MYKLEKLLNSTKRSRIITSLSESKILNQYGKMEIEHFQGITAAPNASGAVQMSVRNYNYNNHNRGIFEYQGTPNQFIGAGLPDNTYRLIMNKASNSLTCNQ